MLFSYEDELKRRKELAKIIDGHMFLSGIAEFKKNDLIILVTALIDRLDNILNLGNDNCIDERKIKDLLYDQKCIVIEALDEDFFKRDKV